jgi:glycosyltransferase involved in cell wall biosynthesis
MPTFSILIPVFNRQKYISHCIQSALDQTFPDLEVVVVDTASDDGTWEICQQFAATDSRVRIFRNESNVGPVRNWKRCINESNAPFGKLLFSDDLLEPDFLKKTLPYLQNPEVGFVFSSARCGENPEDGRIINRYTKKSGVYKNIDFIIKSLFWGDTPHSPGCAIFRTKDLQKNLVLDIPSPTIKDFLTHGAGPDLLLYLLTAKNYPCFAFVDEPLCFFRAHEGSITTSDKNRYLFKCYIQASIWFV